ncbi:hypothetical protein SLEP1_g15766 [Rubroshorea leprosula]|uniref:Uncharacterized protein n=1 Tax=Rubroshorea leprosula TaxID=152421 RepID=A0AAV5ISP3_9ROSI|nr:hypothetical protein SLEP1_g15766 [Rubroshorea leprosula]
MVRREEAMKETKQKEKLMMLPFLAALLIVTSRVQKNQGKMTTWRSIASDAPQHIIVAYLTR